jgi:hypothetical protein
MAIPAIVAPLLMQGLNLLGNAALVKGKDWFKEKTGLDLETGNLSPEQVVELKKIEKAHEIELLKIMQEDNKLEVRLQEIFLADVDSARTMQGHALQQDDVFSKRFIYYFATFWSIVAAVYIAFITFGEIPQANVRFADTVLGFMLGTVIATIIGFFYGSSQGSKDKDVFLEEVVDHASRK